MMVLMLRLSLLLIRVLHLIAIAAFTAAVLWSLVASAWYVGFSNLAGFVALMCGRVRCPLTALENAVRARLEMPEIDGFVKHYLEQVVVGIQTRR